MTDFISPCSYLLLGFSSCLMHGKGSNANHCSGFVALVPLRSLPLPSSLLSFSTPIARGSRNRHVRNRHALGDLGQRLTRCTTT
jgi:hypothetical protein